MAARRVLVTYATRAGSTADIAAKIAEVLAEGGGLQVDLMPVKENPVVGEYDAVVVGSAVWAGHWLPEARDFLSNNASALADRPVAAFGVALGVINPSADNTQWGIAYTLKAFSLARAVSPLCVGIFAGVKDYSKLEPHIAEILKAKRKAPEGDYRDWVAIAAWARRVRGFFLFGPDYDELHSHDRDQRLRGDERSKQTGPGQEDESPHCRTAEGRGRRSAG